MDINEFINLAQKHRLSLGEIDCPVDLPTWKAIFIEPLFRNNSILLNELYTKCPTEYKQEIDQYIIDFVFARTHEYERQYSQTILNWVFDHLEINLASALHPIFIAEHGRGDLIEFLMKGNSENKHDDRLYEISKWLAQKEQFELFKKIASKVDLNTIHDKNTTYKNITSPESNPFVQLFENNKDKKILKYVLENIPQDEDFYLSIIKKCVGTFKYLGENFEHNSLFDLTLSFLKENRSEFYKNFQNKIKDNEKTLVHRTIHRLSIYNVKTLANHDMFSNFLLYRSIETVGSQEFKEILQPSLDFLYENFSEAIIDEAFSQKHKMELFSNLIIRGSDKEAEFIFNKSPYILNDDTKNSITSALLRKGGDCGIEWAKKHLTYDEIDAMSQRPFYKHNLEQLTLWKCENFLYTENKNTENRIEKKKIKI
jgi:hypothetical protein